MKKIYTAKLSPGMQVGKEIVAETGMVLIEKGVRLTQFMIASLEKWGIPFVQIEDGFMRLPDAVASDQTSEISAFLEEYMAVYDQIFEAFEHIRYFKEVPVLAMQELAETRIRLLVDMLGAINYLFQIRSYSQDTFQHSLNVAIISGVIGKWMGYREADLNDVVLAGLLHDIGKLFVPPSILNKPGKLTLKEFEVIQQHPNRGYHVLKQSGRIRDRVCLSVLQHHERQDGSGYPFGLKGAELDRYAQITAIADTYDAMVSDRPYRRGMMPLTALEIISEEMFGKLASDICQTFFNGVQNYITGNPCLLSNGLRGHIRILHGRDRSWTKPIVSTNDGTVFDLRQGEIYIVDLIDET